MAAWQWTILADRVAKWAKGNPGPLAGYALFVIQHVLDDLYHLLSSFCKLGCDPKDISIVGIPYSSRQAAGDAIRDGLGCQVCLPKVFPFDGCVCALLMEALAQAKEQKKRLIILEDGGYAVPLASQLAAIGCIDPALSTCSFLADVPGSLVGLSLR
jgi:hypothetical protein